MKSLVGGEVGSNETIRTISKADQSNGRALLPRPV